MDPQGGLGSFPPWMQGMDDGGNREWMTVAKEGEGSCKRLGRNERSPRLRIIPRRKANGRIQ
jgi:hypothetical protein